MYGIDFMKYKEIRDALNAEVVSDEVVDVVNSPPHYTSSPARCGCGNRIECIQITEHMDFCLGNAVKYIWRAGLKTDAIEDLRKSLWYIQREIDRRSHSAESEKSCRD